MTAKATFYIDDELLQASKMKAAQSDQSLSTLVNDALRGALSEDEEDRREIKMRRKEASHSFDEVLEALKRAGKI